MNKGLKLMFTIFCFTNMTLKRNTDLMNKGLKQSTKISNNLLTYLKRNTDLMNKGLKHKCGLIHLIQSSMEKKH